jgi:hypothetical protein
MTYSTGGLIQATDYNGFVSTTSGANVNAVWNTAYGQTALSTVAAAGTVTATQWATLNTTISSMASHQGTAITSRTNPVAGNVITILSALNTDLTNLNTNQANAATVGTQFTGWTGTASKTTPTGTGTAAWTITFTNVVTFANTTAASNFFNAGGLVKVEFSKTSTGTTEDTQYNAFVNGICGDVYLSGKAASKTINGTAYTGTTVLGGSGTPSTLATGTGYVNLTGTPTILYKQFDTGAAYSTNYVQITGAVTGAALTLVTTWYDDGAAVSANISGGTATTGITFGTAPTTVVTYTPPETTYLTNTWGTPTVASTVV